MERKVGRACYNVCTAAYIAASSITGSIIRLRFDCVVAGDHRHEGFTCRCGYVWCGSDFFRRVSVGGQCFCPRFCVCIRYGGSCCVRGEKPQNPCNSCQYKDYSFYTSSLYPHLRYVGVLIPTLDRVVYIAWKYLTGKPSTS